MVPISSVFASSLWHSVFASNLLSQLTKFWNYTIILATTDAHLEELCVRYCPWIIWKNIFRACTFHLNTTCSVILYEYKARPCVSLLQTMDYNIIPKKITSLEEPMILVSRISYSLEQFYKSSKPFMKGVNIERICKKETIKVIGHQSFQKRLLMSIVSLSKTSFLLY